MNMIIKPDDRMAALRQAEDTALAGAKTGEPLSTVLEGLIRAVEAVADVEMLASVLLVSADGRTLVLGAAPSLPDAYNAAINGTAIGQASGSCGTAAFYGEPVFVSDIKTDPLWTDFRDLALAYNLRACWSLPIKDSEGKVIATFANYYRDPRHPRSTDYEAINFVAKVISEVMALIGPPSEA
jgi:GAF domain-containing protein